MTIDDACVLRKSARILLRPWQAADAEGWFALSQDEGFNRFSYSGYRQTSLRTAEEFILRHQAEFRETGLGVFPIVLNSTGEIIGVCALRRDQVPGESHTIIEIMYRLAARHWQKGFASEAAALLLEYAFHEIRLETVYGCVELTNQASRRVLEKIGMRFAWRTISRGVEVDFFSLSAGQASRASD